MSLRTLNPDGVHAPAGAYSHAVSATGPGRLLHISGQLGIDAQGETAKGFTGQAEQCWRNITAILESADMDAQDLVKVTTFVTDIAQAAELAAVRAPFLGDARPASTLLAVAALMKPEWLIEVEAVAFKAD